MCPFTPPECHHVIRSTRRARSRTWTGTSRSRTGHVRVTLARRCQLPWMGFEPMLSTSVPGMGLSEPSRPGGTASEERGLPVAPTGPQLSARIVKEPECPAGVEPAFPAWKTGAWAARPRAHRQRKERESNPQGSSLVRVQAGCRRQSACPSVSVWTAGFEPAWSGFRGRRMKPGSPTSRSCRPPCRPTQRARGRARLAPNAPRYKGQVLPPQGIDGTIRGRLTGTARCGCPGTPESRVAEHHRDLRWCLRPWLRWFSLLGISLAHMG